MDETRLETAGCMMRLAVSVCHCRKGMKMNKGNPEEQPLSELELIALAGVVKDKQLSELKSHLADGSTGAVDFKVHIVGNVVKGIGTPGGKTEHAATVSLVSLAVFCAVLQCVGVGKARLRRALEEIEPAKVQVNPELSAVFDEVAAEKAAKLPPVTGWSNGRAGAVQTNVSAERIA